ncbi:MRG-domain-containing protein [Tilletiaria anomala UBC 951]|uniref:Chromatin modification-related protein EAF3 n=1 Tax=Tilletiaria anomala (strain ATCC 24038 / CBS 436.72 / UBC 951) TaxID=1037660 RepID=A0A066VNN2_TILAU|nr:MRG-domain-containing protein [Tilletiaria anomala UBC 951]KDN40349.1 MRG-domain-containing protein [Tilletiaria anomala UBC 951]
MQYAVNEKILCFHGPLLYQAKVLKAEDWKSEDKKKGHTGPHYFVHYQGWKQTWDEWVPESRMLKYNDENLARQKALQDTQKAEQQRQRELANPSTSASSGGDVAGERGRRVSGGRGLKRGRDAVEPDEEYQKRPEIRIQIPDVLKLQLVDDWENITKNQLLVPVPREPTVNMILQEYRDHLSARPEAKQRSPAVVEEVLAGLKLYFDKSLGNNLLYKYERQQFVEMRKRFAEKEGAKGSGAEATEYDSGLIGGIEPSALYGAEHLLRLFVNLPGIIAHTTMDVESVAILKEHIADFLQFLAQNKKRFFAQQYEAASPAYHRISQI